MELYLLQTFLTVAGEKSFSRAAVKLGRTQPAISQAIQRLEMELKQPLIDRTGKELRLTDAGRLTADFARRFENLARDMEIALAELRDNAAGKLIIGANESTALYLLQHIEQYRQAYPKVRIEVRRSLSSRIPAELIDGSLELGVVSYDPDDDRLTSHVIFTDHLSFIVSPQHRFAKRKSVSITELGMETFIAHIVSSPYRETVIDAFRKHKVNLNMEVEMPTVETVRRMVQRNDGVAFIPHMCADQEIRQKLLCEVYVEELHVERKVRLVYPAKRVLSHAARAFLELLNR